MISREDGVHPVFRQEVKACARPWSIANGVSEIPNSVNLWTRVEDGLQCRLIRVDIRNQENLHAFVNPQVLKRLPARPRVIDLAQPREPVMHTMPLTSPAPAPRSSPPPLARLGRVTG